MSLEPVADLLGTIVAATRRTLEARAARLSLPALARQAEAREARPDIFRSALARPDRLSVVAECKRRSPAKGVLRVDYDPGTIAAGYAAAGAAAISVLTEPSFFDGSLAHLEAVRAAVTVPILRKDFIVSEYQLFEARAVGADAVLLIVAALTPGELTRLLARATDLGLGVLVEVHSAGELTVAVDAGASIIGVNNRNLRTLAVDVKASETLISSMPKGAVAVSESGLRTADDLTRLRALGYGAFLIGERFMTETDPGAALAQLLTAAAAQQRTDTAATLPGGAEEEFKGVPST
jgi:indole-3-glycerol phosphate synthase